MAQKILGSQNIDIIVDSRERGNHVHSHLSDIEDLNIIEKQLKVGDYICSERVAVERKTVTDFLQSIIDQRIFNQLCDLSESFANPVLLIEGNPENMFMERNIHPNTIRGVLSTIAIDYKVPIIWTRNPRETAHQLFWMARREQVKNNKELAIRCSKRGTLPHEEQEFLIAGLPFVNNVLCRRLLKEFGTPKKVFSASMEKLMKVEGIGKDRSKKIWDILNSEYSEPTEGP
ncbi:MAG: hypothetical protein JW754_05705 [Candidatus Aenigmarchaeota archaeon]|nr:hypothetical protein [Candidatus Aenigmarchaeota archaeon]